jgi:hypothetical protein
MSAPKPIREVILKLTVVVSFGIPFDNLGCAEAWAKPLEGNGLDLIHEDNTIVSVDSVEDNES